ncbi:UNVERIFIED_ORG: hypothetical protein J2W66_001730 [Agrobacterium larrymoorei]|nr:hypothetical protein [Agrobacterium larrymoorei]
MSSNPAASSTDLAGPKVVREVLRTAGHRESQSNARFDMKREGSPLLSAVPGRGVRNKSALLSSLANQKQSSAQARPTPQPKSSAGDHWQDDGGR